MNSEKISPKSQVNPRNPRPKIPQKSAQVPSPQPRAVGFQICHAEVHEADGVVLAHLGELKDRITPHVTNFFRLRLTIEEQEGKRKYKSDGAVMVGEFVCMYVCSCTVSE